MLSSYSLLLIRTSSKKTLSDAALDTMPKGEWHSCVTMSSTSLFHDAAHTHTHAHTLAQNVTDGFRALLQFA